MRGAALLILGILLAGLAFVLSPWPWVAPIPAGIIFVAVGAYSLFTEVDE